MEASQLERVACPSCGGAGGGPFGRAGSAWDDESYVCPRCKGVGAIALEDLTAQSQRPGIAKAVPVPAAPAAPAAQPSKHKASA
jgi:DNA-directed RNA polymerase subunit RPC12/RpoP